LGLSELLLYETEGEARKLAERIFTSGKYLMTLVNDLLDISKAESGKLEIIEEPVHLTELLNDVSGMFRASASKKQIQLMMSLDESLPSELLGDANRVKQILHNLVQNAIKFTDTGHVHVKAELESRSEDLVRIRFAIEDTGIGISPENQKRLFHLFVQVDGSTTRRHGGTGLGLALSKRLVELMNGEIGVESVEGVGSTFAFTLPFIVRKSS
jgi:signal transduction histidine kinase